MIRLSSVLGMAVLISATFVSSTLAGTLKITGSDGTVLAVLDREAIEAAGMQSFETTTPWTDGTSSFKGAPLAAVLQRSGIAGKDITALAFDDYAVTLTSEAMALHAPIIATRLNGELLTLADKGPFWIMFNFDEIPEETAAELRSLAVWHLIEIEVE